MERRTDRCISNASRRGIDAVSVNTGASALSTPLRGQKGRRRCICPVNRGDRVISGNQSAQVSPGSGGRHASYRTTDQRLGRASKRNVRRRLSQGIEKRRPFPPDVRPEPPSDRRCWHKFWRGPLFSNPPVLFANRLVVRTSQQIPAWPRAERDFHLILPGVSSPTRLPGRPFVLRYTANPTSCKRLENSDSVRRLPENVGRLRRSGAHSKAHWPDFGSAKERAGPDREHAAFRQWPRHGGPWRSKRNRTSDEHPRNS